MNIINCLSCGKRTHAYREEKKFCSPKCRTKAWRVRNGIPLTWQRDSTKRHNYEKVQIGNAPNLFSQPKSLCECLNSDWKCTSGSCTLAKQGHRFGPGMDKGTLKRMGCIMLKQIS